MFLSGNAALEEQQHRLQAAGPSLADILNPDEVWKLLDTPAVHSRLAPFLPQVRKGENDKTRPRAALLSTLLGARDTLTENMRSPNIQHLWLSSVCVHLRLLLAGHAVTREHARPRAQRAVPAAAAHVF